MTLEDVISGALASGLALRDFGDMEIGGIVDVCIAAVNRRDDEEDEPQKSVTRQATQADIDALMGG